MINAIRCEHFLFTSLDTGNIIVITKVKHNAETIIWLVDQITDLLIINILLIHQLKCQTFSGSSFLNLRDLLLFLVLFQSKLNIFGI